MLICYYCFATDRLPLGVIKDIKVVTPLLSEGFALRNKHRRVMLMEYLVMTFLILVAATAYISITKN